MRSIYEKTLIIFFCVIILNIKLLLSSSIVQSESGVLEYVLLTDDQIISGDDNDEDMEYSITENTNGQPNKNVASFPRPTIEKEKKVKKACAYPGDSENCKIYKYFGKKTKSFYEKNKNYNKETKYTDDKTEPSTKGDFNKAKLFSKTGKNLSETGVLEYVNFTNFEDKETFIADKKITSGEPNNESNEYFTIDGQINIGESNDEDMEYFTTKTISGEPKKNVDSSPRATVEKEKKLKKACSSSGDGKNCKTYNYFGKKTKTFYEKNKNYNEDLKNTDNETETLSSVNSNEAKLFSETEKNLSKTENVLNNTLIYIDSEDNWHNLMNSKSFYEPESENIVKLFDMIGNEPAIEPVVDDQRENFYKNNTENDQSFSNHFNQYWFRPRLNFSEVPDEKDIYFHSIDYNEKIFLNVKRCWCNSRYQFCKNLTQEELENVIFPKMRNTNLIWQFEMKSLQCNGFKETNFLIQQLEILSKHDILVNNEIYVDLISEDYCLSNENKKNSFNEDKWSLKVCQNTLYLPKCCPEKQRMSLNGCTEINYPMKYILHYFYLSSFTYPSIKFDKCQNVEQAIYHIEYQNKKITCEYPNIQWIQPRYDNYSLEEYEGNVFLKINNSQYLFDFCLNDMDKENSLSSHVIFYCGNDNTDVNNTFITDKISSTKLHPFKIQKCCKFGEVLLGENCVCDFEEHHRKTNLFFENIKNASKNIQIGIPECATSLKRTVLLEKKVYDNKYLLNNLKTETNYCIDLHLELESNKAYEVANHLVIFTCGDQRSIHSKDSKYFTSGESAWIRLRRVTIPIGLFISCCCLFFLLLCHVYLKDLRDLHGMILCSYVTSLLIADFSLLIILIFSNQLSASHCIFTG